MSKLACLVAALALAGFCGLASGQRFAPGYCPTVTAQENFDKTKFFGNWIEVEKTPSIFDLMMRCLVVDYSDDQDNTVNVVVRGVSLAGLPLTVNGDGLLQDVHRSGFYSIRYGFGVPFQGTMTTIIDTDYDDYAVVYSCTNSLLSGVFHSEYIWVLSRSGKISNPTRQNIYEKLDKLNINRSGLTMSDRSACPTNSSNVARESDTSLAAQNAASPLSPVAAGATAGAGAAAAGAAPEQQAPAAQASPAATLEKAGQAGESAPAAAQAPAAPAAQKSVVVPLLYDPPSPVSSGSVGASPKSSGPRPAGADAAAKPAAAKQAQAAKPAANQAAAAAAAQAGKAAANQAAQAPAAGPQQAQQAPAPAAGQQAQLSGQQQASPAPSGLLAKLVQPKQS